MLLIFLTANAVWNGFQPTLRCNNSFITKKPKISGITLSGNFAVLYLENGISEYNFVLCNKGGQTIKDAYMIVDEHANKENENDDWKIVHANFIDRPLQWKKHSVTNEGKIDIDYKERAAFSLGQYANEFVANGWLSMFFLTLFGEREGDNVMLEMGKYHRLIVAFRGKSERGDILPDIRWYFRFKAVPRGNNSFGGLDDVIIKRIKKDA